MTKKLVGQTLSQRLAEQEDVLEFQRDAQTQFDEEAYDAMLLEDAFYPIIYG